MAQHMAFICTGKLPISSKSFFVCTMRLLIQIRCRTAEATNLAVSVVLLYRGVPVRVVCAENNTIFKSHDKFEQLCRQCRQGTTFDNVILLCDLHTGHHHWGGGGSLP